MSNEDDDPIFDLTDAGEGDRRPARARGGRKPAAEREMLPPSDKQIAFARKLADERGEAIPVEVEADRTACSAFIDRMLAMPKKAAAGGSVGGARPPSEKQVIFARKLADERGIAVPGDALADSRACSAFIDEMLGKAAPKDGPKDASAAPKGTAPKSAAPKSAAPASGAKPPSDKQIAYAQRLAREKSLRLPAGYQSDWRICRDFIDGVLGKSAEKTPDGPSPHGPSDGPPDDGAPPW